MEKDMLAPYQETAQQIWNDLQAQILEHDQALEPMLRHHFRSTGKLIRPALMMAFYDLLQHGQTASPPDPSKPVGQMALALEILHNATLVHDDLQDGDEMRRGVPTVWKAFGMYQAVNAGSGLYFHALRLTATLDVPSEQIVRLNHLLADQTLHIIAGQALEKQLWDALDREHQQDTEALYLEVVQRKTSALFALPMMSAAILFGLSPTLTQSLEHVARPLGALFQIQDDILDLYGQKGRDTVGTDIAEGKPSYPALHALRHTPPDDASRLYKTLRMPREQTMQAEIDWAIEMMREQGSLRASLDKLAILQQEALEAMPQTLPNLQHAKDFLQAVCDKINAPIAHLL